MKALAPRASRSVAVLWLAAAAGVGAAASAAGLAMVHDASCASAAGPCLERPALAGRLKAPARACGVRSRPFAPEPTP